MPVAVVVIAVPPTPMAVVGAVPVENPVQKRQSVDRSIEPGNPKMYYPWTSRLISLYVLIGQGKAKLNKI